LTVVKCFEKCNTHAHKFYTLWFAGWKQGQSGCGLRKRKVREAVGVDLHVWSIIAGGVALAEKAFV
jgi:hypothetical protein